MGKPKPPVTDSEKVPTRGGSQHKEKIELYVEAQRNNVPKKNFGKYGCPVCKATGHVTSAIENFYHEFVVCVECGCLYSRGIIVRETYERNPV